MFSAKFCGQVITVHLVRMKLAWGKYLSNVRKLIIGQSTGVYEIKFEFQKNRLAERNFEFSDSVPRMHSGKESKAFRRG